MALICLGEVPWDDSWKRNQSMVYELSKLALFDRVVFVNPRAVWVKDLLITGPGTFPQRLRSIIRAAPRSYGRKIRICSMFCFLPMKRHLPSAERFEEKCFASMVRYFQGNRPTVLLNNHPLFFSSQLLDELMQKAVLSVFDLSDDFVEFYRVDADRLAIGSSLHHACSHSDLVFTVNEHLKNKYAHFNSNMYVVPNATNFENFHRDAYRPVDFLEDIRARGGSILGYSGNINSIRVDYALLEALASNRLDCQYVFIGGADPSFHSIVERHPNLHHHPWVSSDRLADCIRYFDAAIIPFQVNAHTLGNDLLKFNDYLAMGKPIVTTDMGGARKYEGLLWIATDAAHFLASIDEALGESSPEIRQRRMDMAATNSWRQRALEIQDILLKHLPSDPDSANENGGPC